MRIMSKENVTALLFKAEEERLKIEGIFFRRDP